jgi:hypothetical protein
MNKLDEDGGTKGVAIKLTYTRQGCVKLTKYPALN